MGFLDDVAADLQAGGGGDYLTGPEKQDIISKSIPFSITGIERGKTRFNDDAFTLTVQLAGEERKLEFKYGSREGEATSRDESLQGLLDSGELAAGPIEVTLAKLTPGAQGFMAVVPVGTPVDSKGVVVRENA